MPEIDFATVEIRPTKHCILTWLRKWDWGIEEVRNGLTTAYKIDKVGNNKYEAYCNCGKKSRKLIFARHESAIVIITCAEGTEKL